MSFFLASWSFNSGVSISPLCTCCASVCVHTRHGPSCCSQIPKMHFWSFPGAFFFFFLSFCSSFRVSASFSHGRGEHDISREPKRSLSRSNQNQLGEKPRCETVTCFPVVWCPLAHACCPCLVSRLLLVIFHSWWCNSKTTRMTRGRPRTDGLTPSSSWRSLAVTSEFGTRWPADEL